MMNDVEFDDVVKHMLADEAKFSIHGGSSAFQEGPSFGLEFRKVGMRVVQVGDGDNPMVDPHIRLKVEERNDWEANLHRCVV